MLAQQGWNGNWPVFRTVDPNLPTTFSRSQQSSREVSPQNVHGLTSSWSTSCISRDISVSYSLVISSLYSTSFNSAILESLRFWISSTVYLWNVIQKIFPLCPYSSVNRKERDRGKEATLPLGASSQTREWCWCPDLGCLSGLHWGTRRKLQSLPLAFCVAAGRIQRASGKSLQIYSCRCGWNQRSKNWNIFFLKKGCFMAYPRLISCWGWSVNRSSCHEGVNLNRFSGNGHKHRSNFPC